jgi:hypothetical protein
MFEKAARLKLRFETCQGCLSAEDLWDLPLTSNRGRANLDEIAIALHGQLQRSSVSFVNDDDKPNELIQLRFDVVKHVIDVRKAENKAAADAHAKAEQKQKLLGILARKQDEELEGKTREELEAMIAAL